MTPPIFRWCHLAFVKWPGIEMKIYTACVIFEELKGFLLGFQNNLVKNKVIGFSQYHNALLSKFF